MQEIELLFKINYRLADRIRKKLKSVFVKTVKEKDIYFYPPDRDFTVNKNGRENLRIRFSRDKNEFTYKKVIYAKDAYSHSIEKNVDINDPENLIIILESLGFRRHFTIEKTREIYKDNTFIITIDDVKDLGLFAEVECAGQNKNKNEIKKLCFDKANELGLKTIQDKGYLRLLEEKSPNTKAKIKK